MTGIIIFDLELELGSSETLTIGRYKGHYNNGYYLYPIDSRVTLVSNDPAIVSVDATGLVTANAIGTAQISVSYLHFEETPILQNLM